MLVRTPLVELSLIEGVAYRQKLRGGQTGVVILRHDSSQPGLALLNHRTGEPDLAAHLPRELFTTEAFVEALELTSGLPYSCRGPVRSFGHPPSTPADPEGAHAAEELQCSPPDALATVSSHDYAAVVQAYTSRKGELSYELLNKALIQAAHSNPFVATMIKENASLEQIRDHVVKANFEAVTGNRGLAAADVKRIVDLLEEVSPKSALRGLSDELRRMMDHRAL